MLMFSFVISALVVLADLVKRLTAQRIWEISTFVIYALVVLGVLIFVHELGHFLIAKWKRVTVRKFSLGFGPKILGKKIGETEYVISAVPLGGYVTMLGEAPGGEVAP